MQEGMDIGEGGRKRGRNEGRKTVVVVHVACSVNIRKPGEERKEGGTPTITK